MLYTQVGNLSTCPALVRLDLNRNQLGSLAGLETCPQLKWLSASGNALTDLGALPALSNLRVGPSTALPCPSTSCPPAFLEPVVCTGFCQELRSAAYTLL